MFYVHRDHNDRLGTGSPGRPPRLSHSPRALLYFPLIRLLLLLLIFLLLLLQCCFTSTETINMLYVHRDHNYALRPQRPYGLLGTGSPAPEILQFEAQTNVLLLDLLFCRRPVSLYRSISSHYGRGKIIEMKWT